jgi:hypothetical protein
VQLARLVNSGTTVLLQIAGVGIRVRSGADAPAISVTGAAASFVVDRGTPEIDIHVNWGTTSPRGRLLFDSGGVWGLYEDDNAFLYCFTSRSLGGLYKTARFDREYRQGVVTLDRERFSAGAPYPLEYPLDELMVINRLAFTGGVEVHGCGVVDRNGRGYLFAGQSGAGKSTIARPWSRAGATVLSDDRVVLRTAESGIMMHGTPWHGDAGYAEPASAPLSAVLFLRQARLHRIVRLRPAEAGALLFSCAFPVFHSADALESTLETIQRAVTKVSVGALEFAPSDDVVPFVRGAAL